MTEEELREKIIESIAENTFCSFASIADDIITLIRDSGLFMDMEMVKGLMFEAQAKKCASCPKNKEPT